MSIQNHVVLLQALTFLAFVMYAYSYCQRPGFICMNKGNCTADRTCKCDRGWGGYDCRAPQKYVNCRKRCSNHGICVMNGLCYCQFGYYGDNCEKKNETISCNMFSMDVTMATPGKRDISLRGADECGLSKVPSRPGEYVYKRSFPMVPNPGTPCDVYQREHLGPGMFSYTMSMSVKRRKQIFSPLDWVTEFICTYERSANGSTKPKEDYKLFDVDILDYLNHPIQSGAKTTMSKEFFLVFFSNKTDYEVLVKELHMYNVWTGEKLNTLIKAGCRTYVGKLKLFDEPIVGEHVRYDGTAVQGTFVNFHPINEPFEIFFDYKVQICKGQCSKPFCHATKIQEARPGLRLILE
ncbi:EGF-like domain-containing protein 2 [Mizuhopecten yessoensis]|uniref:EGF-like domain-containing protein 2 n=1 Tax=Mizuhopecten yessoensis TaxID=6573 RepID=A0A210QC84_MIZYE|nr:EGF-like domain-containing protein 2 [Mizuhopecten yessoensis]OWF46349.1 EGF-like domain-containing protein 2 [Mizuhopecten yessoensis]